MISRYYVAFAITLLFAFAAGAEPLEGATDNPEELATDGRADADPEKVAQPGPGADPSSADRDLEAVGSDIDMGEAVGPAAEQYRVGLAFRDGTDSVLQDFVKAHAWLNVASASGYAASAGERDQLANRMTNDQLAAAQKLAGDYRRTGQDPTAILDAAKLTAVAPLRRKASRPAEAESTPDDSSYGRSGVYVVVGFGLGHFTQVESDIEDVFEDLGFDFSAKAKPGVGVDARVGYRLNGFMAVEFQLQYLPEAKVDVEDTRVFEIETLSLSGAAKFYPIRGSIQPYAMIGAGNMRTKFKSDFFADSKFDDIAIRVGGGVDVYLSEFVALTTEFGGVFAEGDIDGLNQFTFSAGMMFRF